MKWIVTEDGCWLWQGTINADGYGRFGSYLAHRVTYTRLAGPIPPNHDLDHLCKVRHCVNPEHLEPVPHRENQWRSSLAILTPADVVTIRRSDDTIPVLAERYGVAEVTVRQAQTGRAWAGVPMPDDAVLSVKPRTRPTHCKHGHEFTPENTRIEKHGKRKCRACCADRERRARADGRR